MSIRQEKLTIEALEQIDDLCAEFEQKWQTNDPQSIESSLARFQSTEEIGNVQRDALLAELIVLEIDYRRRRGETPAKQEYVERFPQDTQAINDAFHEGDKPTGVFNPPTVQRLAELLPSLQIIELIGAGGMGAVYKARQEGLDRIVALKILPEEFGHDVKFALRFTREARTLAKLNHPNIVALYEFGNVADTYYFLMEYVEGSTLRDIVRSRELAPQHALAIVPHLCDALQYAHDNGVVHRDIKPENILMSIDGSVKIADFGLSRILDSESPQPSLTGTHQVMGTPRYMAPEQLENTHNVDHRADIYSLGVVIYEMLTGELPIGRFAAPSAKVAIDVRLDDVVLRTLEKEPQRRYQRASQIKSDVQSIASDENVASSTATNESPPYAKTLAAGVPSDAGQQTKAVSIVEQEVAGRFLLTRQKLMQRVKDSLRPLLRGQVLQIFFGIGIIILGVQCWSRNTNIPHRLISGIILHVYGIVMIAAAAAVCTRVNRIDYSKPVREIREKIEHLQSVYLGVGPLFGFPWWLMWIPACVAIGFDAVVIYRNSLIPSLVIGVVGLLASLWLYLRALKSGRDSAGSWKTQFSGKSIAAATLALNEIENAQIH
jgi:serine/threonine-protein kinase